MANKQQQIVDALATSIATVTGVVLATPDQSRAFKPADLPAVLILDEQATEEYVTMDGQKQVTLNVRLVLIVDPTLTTAAAIRTLVEGIYAKVGLDPNLGGLISWVLPTGRELALTQTGKMVAVATITLEAVYHTTTWGI